MTEGVDVFVVTPVGRAVEKLQGRRICQRAKLRWTGGTTGSIELERRAAELGLELISRRCDGVELVA